MNSAQPRRSLRLRAKYKEDLHKVRDVLEESLDLQEEALEGRNLEPVIEDSPSSSTTRQRNPPPEMDYQGNARPIDDQPANFRVGRRELPIYNGREDPARYLARYKLACRANNEGSGIDLLRLFPLALVGTAADWFLDMDEADRLTWANLERAFCKRFGTDKLLDSPIRKLSTIKMKSSENVREYIDRFNRIRHACPNESHLSHTITWFISGLARGIRREMKKTSTYTTLRDAFEAAMDIEDEYAASLPQTPADAFTRGDYRRGRLGQPAQKRNPYDTKL